MAGKISEYPSQSDLESGDKFDFSELISVGPDIWDTKSVSYADLLTNLNADLTVGGSIMQIDDTQSAERKQTMASNSQYFTELGTIAASDDWIKIQPTNELTVHNSSDEEVNIAGDSVDWLDGATTKIKMDINNECYIDNGFDVGIGTNAPGAKLDIQGSGVGTGLALRVRDNIGVLRMKVQDNGEVRFGINNNESITVDKSSTSLKFQNAANKSIQFVNSAGSVLEGQILMNVSANRMEYTVASGGGHRFLGGSGINFTYDTSATTGGLDLVVSNDSVFKLKRATNGYIALRDGKTFTIGSINTGLGTLHVHQDEAAGAKPVIYLEQVDTDESFMQFEGTAAAATITNSLVAVADVTTAVVAGYKRIEVIDLGLQITNSAYYVPFYALT